MVAPEKIRTSVTDDDVLEEISAHESESMSRDQERGVQSLGRKGWGRARTRSSSLPTDTSTTYNARSNSCTRYVRWKWNNARLR